MNSVLAAYFSIIFTVFFTVLGQVIIKSRLSIFGSFPTSNSERLSYILLVFLDPFVIVGFASAFLASVFWIVAMSRFEISFAYPLVVCGLVISSFSVGVLFLGESFSIIKLFGLALIILGVYMVGK